MILGEGISKELLDGTKKDICEQVLEDFFDEQEVLSIMASNSLEEVWVQVKVNPRGDNEDAP